MLIFFLYNSTRYEPRSLHEFVKPIKQFLNRENALLLMKVGEFKECFEVCIDQVKDFNFATKVARKGFEWHQKDRRVFYNLFRKLVQTGDEENKKLAVQILVQNCQHIPFEKITKNFDGEEEFDDGMKTLYSSMFSNMD